MPAQAFPPRALLGAMLASGGCAAPRADVLNGERGALPAGRRRERKLPGKQTPIRPQYFLVFSRGCKEGGPSACIGRAVVAVPQLEVLLPAFGFR